MYEPERSHGWTTFAAIAFAIAGSWNAILGITAIAEPSFFRQAKLPFGSLNFWAITWLSIGTLQGITAMLLMARRPAGRALGLILASVSIVVTILPVGAREQWTVLVLALDALIIFSLTAEARPQVAAYDQGVGPSADLHRLGPAPLA